MIIKRIYRIDVWIRYRMIQFIKISNQKELRHYSIIKSMLLILLASIKKCLSQNLIFTVTIPNHVWFRIETNKER